MMMMTVDHNSCWYNTRCHRGRGLRPVLLDIMFDSSVNIPPNLSLKENATKGFMVVSSTIQCGEQHIRSWTVLCHGKFSKMT